MGNKDELDHIMANVPKVLKLSAQYENRPYVEEFRKKV